MPLESGLKLLINYFTIILTVPGKHMFYFFVHSVCGKYLAQELLGLSEENMSV